MKTTIAIILAGVIIGGAIIFSSHGGSSNSTGDSIKANNVSVIDGKQIVIINARGGYQPERSIAKAGVPTILRFVTNGTFDCSSSIRIPSMGIFKNLPQTGNTDIDLGVPQAVTIEGTCGMGMYQFQVDFQA